jgi:protein SCO1/2
VIRYLIITLFILLPAATLFVSCEDKLPLNINLANRSYSFFNQDSVKVNFPDVTEGQVTVMGFIYAHCPDICPMTTHNMNLTEQRLKKEQVSDVKFVSITFDPGRDYPSVLKKYGEIRGLDFKTWTFLWGDKKITKELLNRLDVVAIPTDSSFSDDGELTYSMIHTDRISLIDKEGKLKKNYRGSKVNLDELYNDIKYLRD